jgi:Lipocalin-like domain
MRKILIISLFFLSACGKENLNPDSIIGKWELNSQTIFSNGVLAFNYSYEKAKSYISQFNSNNSYTLSYMDSVIQTGTYKIDSSNVFIKCSLVNGYITSTQNFEISGNQLTLSDSGRDMAGTFKQNFIYTRIR